MAKALRVFQLAKELGVASKAVVTKCQAEQVPDITNHMSMVKVGLAETIRQWFSEGQTQETLSGTAVEVADKVDMTKARKGQKRRTSEVAKATVTTQLTETPTAEVKAKPPSATPSTKPVPKQAIETTATAARPSGTKTTEQPQKLKPADQAETSEPAGVPNVPERPEQVKPVGQQLQKPKEAQLKGPKLVRIEQADHIEPPKPRRTMGDPTKNTPVTLPPTRAPSRGRPAQSQSEPAAQSSKRRMLNTRRGRSADALPTGPSQFSKADMEELDARLRGATGFIKQRRRDMRKREQGGTTASMPVISGGKVEIEEPITIKALSAATGIKGAEILKYLFQKGIMATINSAIDPDAAMEVALEYNIELDIKERQTALELLEAQFEQRDPIDQQPRPPIVTVLGHVDHGKTSLLDRIRKADVAAHESGGITQHVGAYRVTIESEDAKEKTVIFLDTPGHEAFTSMRARGAQVTDLIVLVVAADDGVMPQTIESINHAKAAGVPMIVALNKIDRPEATTENIRRIYGQLAEHGLNPVEWGGETEVIKTSAETGEGVNDLLEILDYQAELLELKSDHGGSALGTVIEAQMQPGRGSVARVLVQEGQLAVGQFIVIGRAFGRVRDMTDDRAKSVQSAGPATPVELSGINEIPDAGDKFYVCDSLKKAEQVALQYREHERQRDLAGKTKVTLDTFADQIKAGQTKHLRVVLKADVQGSVDVLRESLRQIGTDEVSVSVLHAAVGGITESDVLLADASEAVIIGFQVAVTPPVREIAETRDVDIRLYRVIYELTDDVRKALEGMLDPERTEEELGTAEVRQMFKISKVGLVAGCLVTDGLIQRGSRARVIRDGLVVTEDRELESLRRIKEDVREVRSGTECGIRITGFEDIKPGDSIGCYKVVEVKRSLAST